MIKTTKDEGVRGGGEDHDLRSDSDRSCSMEGEQGHGPAAGGPRGCVLVCCTVLGFLNLDI